MSSCLCLNGLRELLSRGLKVGSIQLQLGDCFPYHVPRAFPRAQHREGSLGLSFLAYIPTFKAVAKYQVR